jgi:HIV Tat-specific factor 1
MCLSEALPAALNQHGGYFKNPDVMFWKEGQGEWQPLKQLPELNAALQQAPPAGTPTVGDAAAPQSGAQAAAAAPAAAPAGSQRGAAAAAAPAQPADPELAGFLSEISALEADTDGADVPPSPPPDERCFEDDDGTIYVWDSALRKFMPEGEAGVAGAAAPAAAALAYNEADMVYEAEEEAQPEYVPPPKVRVLRPWPPTTIPVANCTFIKAGVAVCHNVVATGPPDCLMQLQPKTHSKPALVPHPAVR